MQEKYSNLQQSVEDTYLQPTTFESECERSEQKKNIKKKNIPNKKKHTNLQHV